MTPKEHKLQRRAQTKLRRVFKRKYDAEKYYAKYFARDTKEFTFLVSTARVCEGLKNGKGTRLLLGNKQAHVQFYSRDYG